MPYVYCVLCGNHEKSVSYHAFPKKEEFRKQWLAFCGIDEHVLNTATRLCSNHFREKDLIKKVSRGAFTKPNAVPSIRKKKKTFEQSNSSISEVCYGTEEKYIVTDNVNVDSKISIEDFVIVDSQSVSPSIESVQLSNYQTPSKSESYVGIIGTPDLAIKTEIPFEIANDGLPIQLRSEGTLCLNCQTSLKAAPCVSIVGTPDLAIKAESPLEIANDCLLTPLKNECTQQSNCQTSLKAVPESCTGIIGTSDLTIKTEKSFEITNNSLPAPLRSESTLRSNCQITPKTVSQPCFNSTIKKPRRAMPKTVPCALELAKQRITRQRRKIKTLQQARNRLLTRITTMKDLVKHLEQKNLFLETERKIQKRDYFCLKRCIKCKSGKK